MRRFEVILDEKAIQDLDNLAAHIAQRASPSVALGFIERIEAKCESLACFPERGTLRDDLGASLRTFGVERRATVLFKVEKRKRRVVVLGVYYGGRQVKLD